MPAGCCANWTVIAESPVPKMAGREKAFTRHDGTLDPYMLPRSGIDMGMNEFAAVTESAIGTKQTSRPLAVGH